MMTVDTAKAYWVNQDTIAWIGAQPGGTLSPLLLAVRPDDF